MIISYVAEAFGTRQIKQSLSLANMGRRVYVYAKVWCAGSVVLGAVNLSCML